MTFAGIIVALVVGFLLGVKFAPHIYEFHAEWVAGGCDD